MRTVGRRGSGVESVGYPVRLVLSVVLLSCVCRSTLREGVAGVGVEAWPWACRVDAGGGGSGGRVG